jgi:hypothetical protein
MVENKRALLRDFRKFLAQNASDLPTVESDGMRVVSFEKEGAFDYELYKEVQIRGNKYKLDNQWVPEEHIRILSEHMVSLGLLPKNGICHGTRQGFEQAWFREHLPGEADVFGTEISDTATDFPNTIQWDFHEIKPEWKGAMDFIYSNSWDHSYDPVVAFTAWASCLAPGGVILLDHGFGYAPEKVSVLDPCGIAEDKLVDLLNAKCAAVGKVVDVIMGGKHQRHQIRTVIFRAHA